MATPIAITDAEFQEKVIDASHETPVLVDFWAEWCGPCKMIAPHLDALAQEWDGQLIIGKVDVDANQNTMMAYGIMGIPALLLFKDGEKVLTITGFRDKNALVSELSDHVGVTMAVSS